MLHTHEIAAAVALSDDLAIARTHLGPYGRTLDAIEEYRRASLEEHPDQPRLDDLSHLTCIYAVGIVRGNGHGISPWPETEAEAEAQVPLE